MFCPFCAEPIKLIANGELSCVAGDMQLTPLWQSMLHARFGGAAIDSAQKPCEQAKWYCPTCREPLRGPELRCDHCHGSLSPLNLRLIELCPHR